MEGGGALISQAIHQVDVLLYLIGAVEEVFGYWQLGAAHKIESEDCVSAVMRYASGATGVIQAATALWPGYPERVEIHGEHKGRSWRGQGRCASAVPFTLDPSAKIERQQQAQTLSCTDRLLD